MSQSSSTSAASARLNRRVVTISIGAALGGFLFGFDSSIINGAVDSLQGEFELSDALTGFAVASALLGCAVGAWFAGAIANKHGRIRVMVIASIFFFASAIGSGLATGVWGLIAWRMLGGLAVGAASVIAPAYIAEVSPSKFRGRLGSLQQLAIVLGIFAALLTGQLFAGVAGGASETLWFGIEAWRWMFMAEALPAAIYGIAALRLPESPRYLVGRGQEEQAAEVLRQFTGIDNVDEKVQEIYDSLESEKKQSLADLRGKALGLKPIVWTGILLSVFQQFVGINVIFYYSTSLWKSVGFEEDQAFLTSTITSVTNIVVTIIAILLVDKVGRRIMLLVGSGGMTLSLGLMAVAFSQAQTDSAGEVTDFAGAWGTVAVLAANGFVIFFGATWGPVVWVLLGEMFPNRIRASALAVAAAAQWLANWAVTTTFPSMASIGLTFSYAVYATMALLSLLFVFFRVPETKGMELEEMNSDVRVKRGKFASASAQ